MTGKQYIYLKFLLIFSLLLLLVSIAACTGIPDDISSAVNPVINTFEVKPSSISAGEIAELHWKTSNAQTVHIDNGIGDVSLNGTIAMEPAVTRIYTLTATNPLGTSIAKTQVIVVGSESSPENETLPVEPLITKFESSRESILRGEYAVLSWNVLNAEEVMISSVGDVENSGEKIVYPYDTTTYILTAINSEDSSTESVTVTVTNYLNGDSTNIVKSFYVIPEESGSMIKKSGFLDYEKKPECCAGDTSANFAARAFLSFDISSIPYDAVIEEAILDLSDYGKTGDPTYTRSSWGNMGALEVYYYQYDNFDDLDFSDYDEAVAITQIGEFIEYPLSPWECDVMNSGEGTPVIQNLLSSGATRCRFRIQFFTSTNWDVVSDMLCFDNAVLTIKYSVP
jgi:hypothetical protein